MIENEVHDLMELYEGCLRDMFKLCGTAVETRDW